MENRSDNSPQRIGLIAGAGEIPVYFARKASENGIRLVSVSFSDEIGSHLQSYVEKNYCIGIGQSDKIFRTLKAEGISDILMLGKVDKSIIFRLQMFDLRSLNFLKRLHNREDKTLLVGVIRELEREGIAVLSQKEYMSELFPAAGVLTRRQPAKQDAEDIEFGMPIARKLADMEIGQTLIVHKKTVVAVEGVEGTDQTIQRGCALSKGKCIAIKVSRTDQDYRYDCPGIGTKTVEQLVQGKASVLAVEAGRVMMIDLPGIIKLADAGGLSIVAV